MSFNNWFIKKRFMLNKEEMSALSILERREQFEKGMALLKGDYDVYTEDVILNKNLKSRWIKGKNTRDDAVILYFHGGGFCMGTIDCYTNPCSSLVDLTQINLFLPEYRLAPENPFPAGLFDCVCAYDYLIECGYEPNKIIFVGDSAGANLALSTSLILDKRNAIMPSSLALMSPCTAVEMYDDDNVYVDMEKSDALLSARILRLWSKAYRGGYDSKDPLISPVYANLSNLPPIFMNIGTSDMLCDSARLFHMRALDYGVDSTFITNEGCFHSHHLFSNYIPEAQKGIESMKKFIEKKLVD